MRVALLTGGKDVPYVLGLVPELTARGIEIDLVGNEEMVPVAEARSGRVDLHDLVGSLDARDGRIGKVWRVLSYYARLVVFAVRTDARLFHILWFRRFPLGERVLLGTYFKLLGKRIAFTAHNIDDRARDGLGESAPHRLSLRFFYRIVDHVFVHTPAMKHDLVEQFSVDESKVTVVPFGINDVFPVARVTRSEARRQLGLSPDDKVLLFFGRIAPYKGVEDLLSALARLVHEDPRYVLVLAGPVKDPSCETYWATLRALIQELHLEKHVQIENRFIPDGEVGLFFRASDVTVLPYRRIYQSGVVALSYAHGIPVVASDVGAFKADVIEGKTGLVFGVSDVAHLARTLQEYFASNLFKDLEVRGPEIREHGIEAFSWTRNGERTASVYEHLTRE
jgi:glycosyltransferase involved in cell wall biosynthesis